MYSASTQSYWQYLKNEIGSLQIDTSLSVRSFFCTPVHSTYSHLLIHNLKHFLDFVDESANEDTTKVLIIVGALCYFYDKENNWKNSVLGSPFVGAIYPLVEGTEKIKLDSIKELLTFLQTSGQDIFSRTDDRFTYLFSKDSLTDIEKYIEDLKDPSNHESLSDTLWRLSPFS